MIHKKSLNKYKKQKNISKKGRRNMLIKKQVKVIYLSGSSEIHLCVLSKCPDLKIQLHFLITPLNARKNGIYK